MWSRSGSKLEFRVRDSMYVILEADFHTMTARGASVLFYKLHISMEAMFFLVTCLKAFYLPSNAVYKTEQDLGGPGARKQARIYANSNKLFVTAPNQSKDRLGSDYVRPVSRFLNVFYLNFIAHATPFRLGRSVLDKTLIERP